MADTYLFNSKANGNARVSLKADDSTGVRTIEVRDAADAIQRSIVMTPLLIDQVLGEWRRNQQGVVLLDGPNNVFVAFPGYDASSVWPCSEEGSHTPGTDQVPLNTEETAIFMGWLKDYTAPP